MVQAARARTNGDDAVSLLPVTSKQFDKRYAYTANGSPRPGATRAAYERGKATAHQLYHDEHRLALVEGATFYATNPQRAEGLELRGRKRCDRTIRRHHRRLEAMGLLAARWDRRSGAARRPGEMDRLEITFFDRACVRPPLRGTKSAAPPLKGGAVKADLDPTSGQTSTKKRGPPLPPAGTAHNEGAPKMPTSTVASQAHPNGIVAIGLVVCPDSCVLSVKHLPPPLAAQRRQLLARVRLLRVKIAIGWGVERSEEQVHQLRSELRQLGAPEPPACGWRYAVKPSGHDTDRTLASRSEGFRWST